ncbi:MAG: ABC transporter permease, partial [Treponema sp.]|nr:ABC transporter permease [Treponema sp.]
LGATKFQSVRMILVPSVKSGLISALIFTFIPIFGAYSVPMLVGGTDSSMIGNIIVDQIMITRNWPLACAFSLVITLISLAGVIWMIKAGRKDEKLHKK